jgi:hypothetical protein
MPNTSKSSDTNGIGHHTKPPLEDELAPPPVGKTGTTSEAVVPVLAVLASFPVLRCRVVVAIDTSLIGVLGEVVPIVTVLDPTVVLATVLAPVVIPGVRIGVEVALVPLVVTTVVTLSKHGGNSHAIEILKKQTKKNNLDLLDIFRKSN